MKSRRKKTKKRNCLRCGKLFLSEGSENRVCKPCQEINRRINYRPVNIDIPRQRFN